MDHEPLHHESFPSDCITALEACRPGRGDEALPEVADRLAHASPEQVAAVRRSLERVDLAMMAAIQQAPVPAGLAERLLRQIAAAEGDANRLAPEEGAASLHPHVEPAERASDLARLPTKRLAIKWLAPVCGLALAASLLVAAFVWPRETVEFAEMQTEVRALYEADNHAAGSLQDIPADVDPANLGGVSSDWVVGWHTIELLGRDGYAYELAHRRARRTLYGTLYVVPLKAWRGPVLGGLRAGPVTHSTSGTMVAAWTDETNAYFLVAKGDSRAISAFFPRRMA